MFIHAIGSDVFHIESCAYVKRLRAEKECFSTEKEARSRGLRFCNCCSPLYQRHMKGKLPLLRKAVGKAKLSLILFDNAIHISSRSGKWLLLPEGANRVALYHKNVYRGKSRIKEGKNPGNSQFIPDFHRQKTKGHSLCDHLRYILNHDTFRDTHPLTMDLDDRYIRRINNIDQRKAALYGKKKAKKQAKNLNKRKKAAKIWYTNALIDQVAAGVCHVTAKAG